jgi:hypothetical protein
MGHCDVIGA